MRDQFSDWSLLVAASFVVSHDVVTSTSRDLSQAVKT